MSELGRQTATSPARTGAATAPRASRRAGRRGRQERRRFWEAPLFKPPGWVWQASGEVGWWVRREWHERLLNDVGLRLAEWRAAGRLSTVKTGPHRVVYRVDLPEGAVYIKHFKVPGYREMLRQWMRRGKGRNEAKRARKLARVGIPTITPIALGEQRRRAFLFENYLISPEIAGTRPLDEFVERHLPGLPANEAARLRHALAREVAELTARLHNLGFVHQDFHPGNLLVRVAPGGRVELTMIDLDALRRRKRLELNAVRDNLALLDHYFWWRCDRTDRLRFLKKYLEKRGSSVDLGAFASSIETATRNWAERLWRRWGRRCCGTNKYFYVEKSKSAWGVASRSIDSDTLRQLLLDPDAPFHASGTRIIKDSRTTTVAESTLVVDGVARPVIYKRFNRKKWLDPVYSLFRPTRGWRAWQAGQHLDCRGVPTPTNLLYLHRCSLHALPTTSYVVTAKVEDAQTLADFARGPLCLLPEERRRAVVRTLARSLARLIRSMHDRSLSHRDLKGANILIAGSPEVSRPELALIDLVGVELNHPLPRRRIVQNLARLYLSLAETPGRTRTDYLRFLRAYMPWARAGGGEWKPLWRDVERAAGTKRAQNVRRNRPLS